MGAEMVVGRFLVALEIVDRVAGVLRQGEAEDVGWNPMM